MYGKAKYKNVEGYTMELTELLKKGLYLGVGAIALSGEKIKQLSEDLVNKGEMTQDEAKKFTSEVEKRADEEKEKVEGWIKEQLQKALKQMGIADSKKIKQLEERIALLEAKLENAGKE